MKLSLSFHLHRASRGERQGNRVYKLRGCSQPPRRLRFPFEFFRIFGKDKGFPFSAISFSGAGLSTSEAEKNTEQRPRGKPEEIQPDRRLNPPDAAVFPAQVFSHQAKKSPLGSLYAGREGFRRGKRRGKSSLDVQTFDPGSQVFPALTSVQQLSAFKFRLWADFLKGPSRIAQTASSGSGK